MRYRLFRVARRILGVRLDVWIRGVVLEHRERPCVVILRFARSCPRVHLVV